MLPRQSFSAAILSLALTLTLTLPHRAESQAADSAPAPRRAQPDSQAAARLNPIVTTGTGRPSYLKDSPVKVEVITQQSLQRNATDNIMDHLSFIPGINQQVDCGVCFTNNIRINGMEGAYTAVLIDGAPMMSALATVYGLNSIDPRLIEQIEITKGPNSTLYGSEAMGGVINVITKDPQLSPRLSIDSYVTSHGETSTSLAAAPTVGGRRTLVSLSGAYNNRHIDRNGDSFSDLPLVTRFSAFNKWSLGTTTQLDLSGRYYYEDRFGGTKAWSRADRGSATVYGESIRTNRIELLGTYQFSAGDAPIRAEFSFNWHDQDSYYGDMPYLGTQTTTFGQIVWMPTIGRHTLGLGATLRHQTYRDSTATHHTRERRFTPGVFAQDEFPVSSSVTLLAGLRADHHAIHGIIPSPRFAIKWDANDRTAFRINAATGFRVVNLFTEDHAALTGARDVRIDGTLDPERSVNISASLHRAFNVRGIYEAMTLDIDAYYTRFSNRILPDYDSDPNLIIYRNLDGYAETRGISIAAGYATVRQPLALNAGITIQEATTVESNAQSAIPFSPRVQGVFTVSYKFPRGITSDWTGRVLGSMPLPYFEGFSSTSPWFSEHHVQVTKRMTPAAELYVGMKNIFDYVQPNAIINADDPFGDDFDTARVYGPLQGRRIMLGVRYSTLQ